MEILDIKDKKFLSELDFNARETYSKLGEKIGLSKQGVEYKLNSLIKNKIILGFYPVINIPKLGYMYCRLAISFKNTNNEKEQEIIEYLKSLNEVFWIITLQGIYDLGIVVWAKQISDFKKTIDKIFSKYGYYIKNKNETIATNVIHFNKRYLLKDKKQFEIHISETKNIIEIDETDKKILKILCENARIPIIEIASKLNITAKIASYRIKKLEKLKIIEGYRPIINHNILDLTHYKLWISLNHNSQEEIDKLYNYIKSSPSIVYIVKGIGLPEDLDIELIVKNNNELFEFIKNLRQTFPTLIGEYKTIMLMEMKKVKYFPF